MTVRESGYATILIKDEVIRMLRTRDQARPTFLYLAYNAPRPAGKTSVAEGGRHQGVMSMSDVLSTRLPAISAPQAIPSDLDGRGQWGAPTGTSTGETPDYVVSSLASGRA